MPSVRKFDICIAKPLANPRPGEKQVWWHRIGRASENDRGQISLFFDSLPIPDKEGRCQAMIFEQRERDDNYSGGSGSAGSRSRPAREYNDDDIPL